MGEVLYLKIDKNIQIKSKQVVLGDIAEMNCAEKAIVNKIKTLRLPTQQIKGPGRYVFSVLDVIDVIQKEYPSLEVNNL